MRTSGSNGRSLICCLGVEGDHGVDARIMLGNALQAAGQYIGSGMALLPVLVYAANGIGIHALYPYAGMRNASIRLALGACIVLNRHCRVFNPVVLFALNTGFPAQNLAHK